MICYVYRSNRKRDTYLYIKEEGDFSCIPETVLQVFGSPEFSLSFDLHTEKRLAQADTNEVMNRLETEGFYLQLPQSDYDIARIEEQIIDSLQNSD